MIRFILANVATGSAIGWMTGGTLVLANTGGLRDMILASANPPVLLAMMAVPVGGLFGVGYLATALMFLEEE
jgi:hypothetical protein